LASRSAIVSGFEFDFTIIGDRSRPADRQFWNDARQTVIDDFCL
jgi:hypothetical protein